jgi:hypothetical protein
MLLTASINFRPHSSGEALLWASTIASVVIKVATVQQSASR